MNQSHNVQEEWAIYKYGMVTPVPIPRYLSCVKVTAVESKTYSVFCIDASFNPYVFTSRNVKELPVRSDPPDNTISVISRGSRLGTLYFRSPGKDKK